jgi:carbon-monoxide dehydrogenase small subunit
MSVDITLRVNGREHAINVAPTEMLVNVLRDRLHLTGTHRDCGMGICGSCTVLLNGRPVSACILLAVQADGEAIETVEGLAQAGQLHPLQLAFLTHGAVQCGFCPLGS